MTGRWGGAGLNRRPGRATTGCRISTPRALFISKQWINALVSHLVRSTLITTFYAVPPSPARLPLPTVPVPLPVGQFFACCGHNLKIAAQMEKRIRDVQQKKPQTRVKRNSWPGNVMLLTAPPLPLVLSPPLAMHYKYCITIICLTSCKLRIGFHVNAKSLSPLHMSLSLDVGCGSSFSLSVHLFFYSLHFYFCW